MSGRVLVLLSVLAVAVLTLTILMFMVSLIAPELSSSIGLFPYWWAWWLVDIVVYGISVTVLILSGASIGRFIERRVPIGLDNLRASMMSTSVGVISAAVMIFLLLAYVLGLELAGSLFLIALLFALVPSLISWLLSPAIINIAYGCRYDPELQRIVDRVALRAGMKPPKAMLADVRIPNAFAYSSPVMGRYIAVTRGLLEIMSRDDLEAVIGHELGHHKHRDNAVIMVFGLVPSVVYFLGRFLLFIGMTSRYTDGDERRSSGGGLFLLLLGVALIAVSILLQIMVLALSRLREYYADAHGAKVTSPYSMISALKSLDRFYKNTGARVVIDNSKIRTLFIYALAEPFIGLEELLSTHPPIHKRIAFLESLVGTEIKA